MEQPRVASVVPCGEVGRNDPIAAERGIGGSISIETCQDELREVGASRGHDPAVRLNGDTEEQVEVRRDRGDHPFELTEHTVLTHPEVFANLTAIGEAMFASEAGRAVTTASSASLSP